MSARASLLLLAALLAGCGADIEPYEPTLAGIDNEGAKANKDVSFAQGKHIERAKASDCSAAASFENFDVIVDNQYRARTVVVRAVAEDCSETDREVLGPGEEGRVAVYRGQVLRIVDRVTGDVVNSWRVKQLNSLEVERIILRSTDPDI